MYLSSSLFLEEKLKLIEDIQNDANCSSKDVMTWRS